MEDLFKDLLEDTVLTVDKKSNRLEIRNGAEDGRIFSIASDSVRIGRHPESQELSLKNVSDFVIRSDQSISRLHCILTAVGNSSFLIEDMNSKYGTKLNNTLLTGSAQCKSGDVIEIGDTLLILRSQI